LGVMNYNGRGIRRDRGQARFLYDKACRANNYQSCYNLGEMYRNGRGVTEDKKYAKILYEKSCKLGYKSGCSKVRRLVDEGIK